MLQQKLKSICRFLMPAKKNYQSNIVDETMKPQGRQVKIVYKADAKETIVNEKASAESEWWIN